MLLCASCDLSGRSAWPEVEPGLTPDSIQQKYAQTVVSTQIVPGCVQFLGAEKRFYTAWVIRVVLIASSHICSTPNNGHQQIGPVCRKSANKSHQAEMKEDANWRRPYSSLRQAPKRNALRAPRFGPACA